MADESKPAVQQPPQADQAASAPAQSIDDFMKSRNAAQYGYPPPEKPATQAASAEPAPANPEAPASEPPAGEPPAASQEPAPGEETPPAEGEPPQTPEEEGSEPEGGKKPGKVVSELIDQRKKRREAEERADKAERENAYLRGLAEGRGQAQPQGQQPAAPQPPAPPLQAPIQPTWETMVAANPDVTYDDFMAAQTKWAADMTVYNTEVIRREVAQRTAVDAAQTAYNQRIAEVEKVNPKVREAENVVGSTLFTANQQGNRAASLIAEFIRQHPQGPQTLLYLHEHPADVQRLLQGNALFTVAELGEIAGKFKAAPAAAAPANPPAAKPIEKSKAPPPVKPVVNNGAPVEIPLDQVPIEEFMDERNKAQYGENPGRVVGYRLRRRA